MKIKYLAQKGNNNQGKYLGLSRNWEFFVFRLLFIFSVFSARKIAQNKASKRTHTNV